MDLNLNGKRALVTGGSKGIGWASACALADEGCEVLVASRNAPAGERFRFRATDLSQRGAAEALAEWAGELDILVIAGWLLRGGTGLEGVSRGIAQAKYLGRICLAPGAATPAPA